MRLNIVYGIGRVYWIFRDTGKKGTPSMCIGWMHELGGYWRKGKGPQIRIGKYVLQFGVCKRQEVKTEEDGILLAIEGRILNTPTSEISEWR